MKSFKSIKFNVKLQNSKSFTKNTSGEVRSIVKSISENEFSLNRKDNTKSYFSIFSYQFNPNFSNNSDK